MPKLEMRICRKCGRNRNASFYVGTRGRTCTTCQRRRSRASTRDVRLVETHGIDSEIYDAVLADQGGKCWICRKAYPYKLDVDHDHATEKALIAAGWEPIDARRASLRGLLCKRCNRRMLPAASDDPSTLRRAAIYLEDAGRRMQLIITLHRAGYRAVDDGGFAKPVTPNE